MSQSPVGSINFLCLWIFFFSGTVLPAYGTADDLLGQTGFCENDKLCHWRFVSWRQTNALPILANKESSPQRYLEAREGYLESPLFAVQPLDYYMVVFRSRTPERALWSAIFYDENGRELAGDHCSGIDLSKTWKTHEFCFKAKSGARFACLRFQPIGPSTLQIDMVSIRKVSRRAVVKWADKIYAEMPRLTFRPPSGRWTYLKKTLNRLQTGGALKIVMLGDSIVNDIGNSPYDVLLERFYPSCRVNVITSVRGGTGCSYFADNDHVREYVLPHNPNLVIIGGVSNQGDVESVRRVIRQIRKGSEAEFLILSEVVSEGFNPATERYEGSNPRTNPDWVEKIDPDGTSYRSRLFRMAREERVEFLDLSGPWGRYTLDSARPYGWFLRDAVHANVRGSLVLARIMEEYFSPATRDLRTPQ